MALPVRTAAGRVRLDEVAKMTPDEHRQAFLAFVTGLVGDFDRYLAQGDPDLVRDGVSYNLAGIWLSDVELMEMLREFMTVVQPRLANAPKPGRKRRILGTILLPGSGSDEA